MSSSMVYKVTGEWITNLLRTRFWKEGVPYNSILNLGKSMLINPSISESDKENYIKGILEGKYKLEGETPNIYLTEDNENIGSLDVDDLLKEIKSLKEINKTLSQKLKLAKKSIKNQNKRIDELSENVNACYEFMDFVKGVVKEKDCIYRLRVELGKTNMIDEYTFYHKIFDDNVSDETNKKKFNEFCNEYSIYPCLSEHGYWRWVSFYDRKTDHVLTTDELISRGAGIQKESSEPKKPVPKENIEVHSSDIKEKEPEKELLGYGWLSPSGEFTSSPWGTHEESACKICKANNWERQQKESDWSLCRDYLVFERGYVLIDNPLGVGSPRSTYNTTKITNKQREFLYGYYSDIGDYFKANQFMKD